MLLNAVLRWYLTIHPRPHVSIWFPTQAICSLSTRSTSASVRTSPASRCLLPVSAGPPLNQIFYLVTLSLRPSTFFEMHCFKSVFAIFVVLAVCILQVRSAVLSAAFLDEESHIAQHYGGIAHARRRVKDDTLALPFTRRMVVAQDIRSNEENVHEIVVHSSPEPMPDILFDVQSTPSPAALPDEIFVTYTSPSPVALPDEIFFDGITTNKV